MPKKDWSIPVRKCWCGFEAYQTITEFDNDEPLVMWVCEDNPTHMTLIHI